MNSTPQLDLHPDAESLNAFAEQALGGPEREQILAHLAGCSRCRQVIFLAQQAAAEAKVPAWLPAARPTSQSKAWFWNWRLAWIPAAAMAAALALVVTLHPRHTAPAPEMAKVTPQSEVAVPTPFPQERTGAAGAHRAAPAHTANPAAGNGLFVAPRRPSETLAQESASSSALSAEPGAIAPSTGEDHAAMPTSIEPAQPQAIGAQFQSEPAVTAWQQERQRAAGALSASANTSQVSQKSMRMEAYSAHANRPAVTGSAGPRVAQQSQSTTGGSFDMGTQQQLTGLTASGRVNSPKLPSGLATISRASARNLMLEIDRSGALFLSDDSGEHWQPVPQQWTGRAIEVRAKTSLSGSTAPEMKFELKNETGSTWASADGKTWTAQ
jgi:hypothetical protein